MQPDAVCVKHARMSVRRLGPLAFLFVVACGGAPEPAAPQPAASSSAAPVASAPPAPAKTESDAGAEQAAPPPAPAVATPPTIKLVEPGTAPRRALRYAWKVGAAEYAEVDVKIAASMAVNGKSTPKAELPLIRMTMKIEPSEATPNGDTRVAYETVGVSTPGAGDPALKKKLETELSSIVGLHGKATISPRGVASDVDFDLPATATPAVRAQLDSLRDSLRSMYVPLPEEEVGMGASWEVTNHVPVSGALMDVQMLYKVQALDAKSATLGVTSKLSAKPNQPMVLPNVPPQTRASLVALDGTGSGKSVITFAKLTPTAQSKVAMTMSIAVATEGEKVEMKNATDMEMATRPGKAPPAKK